jgi:Fe-S cluster assembly protein SufD
MSGADMPHASESPATSLAAASPGRAERPAPIGQTTAYAAEWERTEAARAAGQPAWLRAARRQAFDRFLDLGFPGTRLEEWRFTNVAPIAESRFPLAEPAHLTAADIEPWTFADVAIRLVFVNGYYAPALSTPAASLPHGVSLGPLGPALHHLATAGDTSLARVAPVDGHAFTALNTAFLADGASLTIAPHVAIEQPIQVLFVSSPDQRATMSHPRLLVEAGADSQARIVEVYAGTPGTMYFTNAVTEVSLGEHAVVEHCRIQLESDAAFHVGVVQVEAARSSAFRAQTFALSGALLRNDITVRMAGEGVDCVLNGLYLAMAQQLVDNHTTIDHAMPHGTSLEIFKGVLGGRSRGVFNGKIIVRQDAQQTDAKQTNRALLLTDQAMIDTKPQLEIFANDVKCTHGAAIGQLDDDAIFYLRSRGLGAQEARAVLIHAFAGDLVDGVRIPGVQTRLRDILSERLTRELSRLGETAGGRA